MNIIIVILIVIILIYLIGKRMSKQKLEGFATFNPDDKYYWQMRDMQYSPLEPRIYNNNSKYDYYKGDIPLLQNPLQPFSIVPTTGAFQFPNVLVPTSPMEAPIFDVLPDTGLEIESMVVLDRLNNPDYLGIGYVNGDKAGLTDIGPLQYAYHMPYGESNFGRNVADLRGYNIPSEGNNITIPMEQYVRNGYYQFPTPFDSVATSNAINDYGTQFISENRGNLDFLANNCVVPLYGPAAGCQRFNYY
jgi:hypothetical protein